MPNFEENNEILNENLMFKLLNREKYITELKHVIKHLHNEIATDFAVKNLKQEIGKLVAYIDELEYEKLNTLNHEIETKFKELVTSNKQLKTNNMNLKKTNSELIQKLLLK